MNTLKFVPDLATGRLNERDAQRYFSRFGWFAFVYFLVSVLLQNIIAVAVYRLAPSVYGHYLFSEFLSFVPSYAIALPISYLIIKPLPTDIPLKEKMKPADWLGGLCISVALMLVGNYISNILLTFVSVLLGGVSENPVSESIDSMPVWATVIFVVILAPILEELVFRGIVCKKLLVLGEGYAIILPAAFFALCHGNFYQLFYAFTLGCFFSFIYVRTGKLIYSMLYHMVINLLGGVIAPLILELVDYNSLLSDGLVITSENIFGLIGLMWYELIVIGTAIVGIVIMVKKRAEFKPQSGLLQPPEGKAVSCVLLNFGVAAAIALFALTLVGSLLY